MSGILQTVLDAVLSLFGVAFIGWIFWRSLKRSDDPPKLIFKWIFTAVVLGFELTVALPAAAKGGFDAIYGLILTLLSWASSCQ